MKTADLIPLILIDLSEGNKYGIELSKSIEEKTNGKVDIKQPTLYTILKKLEKSKFISSYWQDSDIGGKRHYYRLTENGKMQVSTLPDFSVLVSRIIADSDLEDEETSSSTEHSDDFVTSDNSLKQSEKVETVVSTPVSVQTQMIFDNLDEQNQNSTNNEQSNSEEKHFERTDTESGKKQEFTLAKNDNIILQSETLTEIENRQTRQTEEEYTAELKKMRQQANKEPEKRLSILDLLLDDEPSKEEPNANAETNQKPAVEPIRSTLPSEEVFASNNIDNQTEVQINKENTTILKDEKTKSDEQFASNEKVHTFTKNSQPLSEEYKSKLKQKDITLSNFHFIPQKQVQVKQEIKYVDYKNIKTDERYTYAKKASMRMLYRLLSSLGYLAIMLIFSAIVVHFNEASPIYYVSLIASVLLIIFALTIYAFKYQEMRLNFKEKNFEPNLKKRLLNSAILFAIVLVVVIVINLAMKKFNMLTISNFGNFYAPILIASTALIDVLFVKVYFKNL